MKRHLLYAIVILLLTYNSGVKGQSIAGPSVVCAGSSYTFSVIGSTLTSGFTWVVPAGATGSSTSYSISIYFTSSYAGAPIIVSGNGKSGSCSVSFSYTSGNIMLSGTTPVCAGQTLTYSATGINPVSYVWSTTGGITINSGNGTSAISVTYPSTFSSGNISVNGQGCGATSTTTTLPVTAYTSVPAAATAITGTPICVGTTTINYKVNAIPGATGYVWTVPTGLTITSGANTNSIYMTVGTTFTTGTISVYGTNCKGNGTASTLSLSVLPNLPVSVSVTPDEVNSYTNGSSVSFTATPVNGGTAPIYKWYVNKNFQGSSGTSFSYAPQSGDIVFCSLTSSYSCPIENPDTSNWVLVNNSSFTEPTQTAVLPSNINVSDIVGTIPGNWSVGPSGAANYSIPIKLPPGVGGMVPNLSIDYNSQSNSDGFMGFGWSISGLSSIQRVGCDYYHDHYDSDIQYSGMDNYVLDGQRLIPVGPTNPTTGLFIANTNFIQYRTESDNFALITSYFASGNLGANPDSFIVQTKDGKTLHYGGKSSNATVNGQSGNGIVWNVQLMTDVNGNYMSVHYYNNDDGDCHPVSICYTGNSTTNVAPQTTISFGSSQRSGYINTIYESGNQIILDKLLSSITITNTQITNTTPVNTVSAYAFTYYNNPNSSIYQLSSIQETGENGAVLNSTAITWGTPLVGTSIIQCSTLSTNTPMRYTGDFNGDGMQDLVVIYNNVWYLYLGNEGYFSSTPTSSGPITAGYDPTAIQVGDFNGDGKADLLFTYPYKDSNGQTALNYFQVLLSSGTGFSTPSSSPVTDGPLDDVGPYQIVVGDFKGKGMDEAFVQYSSGYFVFYYNNGQLLNDWIYQGSNFLTPGTAIAYSKIGYVPLKATSDGKTDLLMATTTANFGGAVYIYELDSSYINSNWSFVQVGEFNDTHFTTNKILFGDFNGDGLTDILEIPMPGDNDTLTTWQMYESFGNVLNSTGSTSQLFMPYEISIRTGFSNIAYRKTQDLARNINYFYAYDMDGDGKCDLVDIGRGTSSSNPVSIYVYKSIGDVLGGSTGGISFNVPQTYTTPSGYPLILQGTLTNGDFNHFGDFVGDGTTQLFFDNDASAMTISVYSGVNQYLVQNITNGFGLNTSFTYSPLTNDTIYKKGNSSAYPLMDYQGPMYVVSSVATDDIPGTRDVTNYFYRNARYHLMGKGFLGFEYDSTINVLRNSTTVDNYELYNGTFNPNPYSYSYLKKRTIRVAGILSDTITNKLSLNIHSQATATGISVYNISGFSPITSYAVTLPTYTRSPYNPFTSVSVDCNLISNIVRTTTTNVNDSGNCTYVTNRYNAYGNTSYDSTRYYNYCSNGSWIPSLPQLDTVFKKHYQDPLLFKLATKITYYPNGQLQSTSVLGLPTTTTYQYNTNGTIQQVTTSDQVTRRTKSFSYDPTGTFPISTDDALGDITQYAYDFATGNVLSATAPNGSVTSYTYDAFGRQSSVKTPTGLVLNTAYAWESGNAPDNAVYYKITSSPNLEVSPVKEHYDAFGRLLRTEKIGFNGTSIYTSTIYNALGQVTQTSLPFFAGSASYANNFTYDAYNRLISEFGPAGSKKIVYSGTTTITTTGTGQVSSTTVDGQGNVLSSTDPGGTVATTYKSVGKPAAVSSNGVAVTMTYDAFGRQKSLTDPDAGTTSYDYDNYNEISSQRDTLGNIYVMTYGVLGLDSIRTGPEGATKYYYDKLNPGQLDSVVYPNVKDSYTYDSKGRITIKTKKITDVIANTVNTYNFDYTYDLLNRDSILTYPSGFQISNTYANGVLSQVQQVGVTNGAVIWTGIMANAMGQFTSSTYNDGLNISKDFSPIGQVLDIQVRTNAIQSQTLQNMAYTYDPGTGNLLSRANTVNNLSESFTYDNLNRLTNVSGPTPLSTSFTVTGNTISKTGIGIYQYSATQPHQITSISNPLGAISSNKQCIHYTAFQKVDSINESLISNNVNYILQIKYDANRQRALSKLYQAGNLQITTYYDGQYEVEKIGGNVRQLNYIYGGDGLVGIYAMNNNLDTMYSIHTDNMGSYDVITNSSGAVVENYSFDAWGRRRNPTNWTYTGIPTHSLFSRGYTGHEHLDAFSLINMNGRVYDPLLGRFLSPDITVQAPSLTQSYNRYSYCLNNPFAFTDPSGYTWGIFKPFEKAWNWTCKETNQFWTWQAPVVNRLSNWCDEYGLTFDCGDNIDFGGGEYSGNNTLYVTGGTVNNQIGVAYDVNTGNAGIAASGSDGFINTYIPKQDNVGVSIGNFLSKTLPQSFFSPIPKSNNFTKINDPAGLEPSFVDALVFAPLGLIKGSINILTSLESQEITSSANAEVNFLYHYTSDEAADNILKVGLKTEYNADGYIYLTNQANLSPLQAQLELALPAKNALPTSILQIDVSELSPTIIQRVQGNISGWGPGGGTEYIFNQNIPANLIRQIK